MSMSDLGAMRAIEEIRREVKTIRESQERLSDWLCAIGALLTTLGKQEADRLSQGKNEVQK